MFSSRCLFAAAMLFLAAIGSTPASGHDLPLDRSMNAFVKIDADQAHLLIRVPLDLLRAIQFPLAGSSYDIGASGPAVAAALSALASDVSLRENGDELKASSAEGQLTPLADRSFESYEAAAAHIARPPEPDTKISYELGYLDAHFTYPITSPKSVFTIETAVAADLKQYTKLAVRYLPLGESGRVMMITGGSGPIALNPAWYQASLGFVILGVEHILSGIDHLLFLLCLIIPYRRLKGLVGVITAFTLGHSVTLVGTAYQIAPAGAWFPPFIETAIAASIVYMALENIVGANLRRRWIIAALFGLVHGFGFSAALKDQLQFAGSYLMVSLFSFNIGIEIGQLAVLCVFVPALALLFRGALAGRMGIILASAIIAHTAWHWMVDRGSVLWQTPWPRLTGAAVMTLGQWVVALVLAVGAAAFLSSWLERRRPRLVQPAEQRE